MHLFAAIIDANHRVVANGKPVVTRAVGLKQVPIEPKEPAKGWIRLIFEENRLKMVKIGLAMATNVKTKAALGLAKAGFALTKVTFGLAKAFKTTTGAALVMTKAFTMMTKAAFGLAFATKWLAKVVRKLAKVGSLFAIQPNEPGALGLV